MERLSWVIEFIEKSTYAPFSCEKDEEYYDSMKF